MRKILLLLSLITSLNAYAQREYYWVYISNNTVAQEGRSPQQTCSRALPEVKHLAELVLPGYVLSPGGLSVKVNSPQVPPNNYSCQWSGSLTDPLGNTVSANPLLVTNVALRGAGCDGDYEDGFCHKKEQGEPKRCCEESGNPINKLTGHKFQRERFFSSAGSFPLRAEASYNSSRFTSGRSFLDASWTWTHETSINVIDYVGTDGVILMRPDGGSVKFTRDDANYIYVTDADEIYTLEAIVDTSGSEDEITGYLVVTPEDIVEQYDALGNLVQVTNREGLSHFYTYDELLITVSDDFGNSISINLDSKSRPVSLVDPDGNEYRFAYNFWGLLEYASFPDQTPSASGANPFGEDNPFRQYHYEESFYAKGLTGITDENGDRYVTWDYDNEGYAQLSEHAGGVDSFSLDFSQVHQGVNEVAEVLPLGKQLKTSFIEIFGRSYVTSMERLASGSTPGATRIITYDANGFVASRTDWNGNETRYVNDSRGLETSRTEAFGTPEERTISTTWHPVFRKPTQIVEPGKTTVFTYDSVGHVLSRTDTDTTTQTVPYSTAGRTRVTTFTYVAAGIDGENQIASIDGPRTDVADVTSFTYTPEGYLKTSSNSLGHVTEITSYNARGLPLSMKDSNNVVTNMTYHPRGWLLTTTVVDPAAGGDAVTTNEYDDTGQLTKVTLPNGTFLNYEYDAAHRLVAIENNLGERQEFTLDAAGNITLENTKDFNGNITRTQSRIYDDLSRLLDSIGGASQLSRMSYDDNGNQLSIALDPLGINQQTAQLFDGLNRLTQVTDAINNNSTFTYDARDNLTSVTDQRGLTTTYVYDGLDNLIQLSSPDTGITVYTYDDAGNQISRTDARGVVTNNSFDALNRLTSVSYPSSPSENITYAYDQAAGGYGIGRLTQILDQTGSTTFVYDHRGNQIGSTVTIQGNAYTTSLAYDLSDNLTQMVYPSGRVVDFQLDALGRTQAVDSAPSAGGSSQSLASAINYLPFGPMGALTYGNNLGLVISNDLDYRVSNISVSDNAGQNPSVLGLSYTHNAVDNITAITDSVDVNESQTFVYDLLNRLQDATGDYGNQAFTYDAVGNRLSVTKVAGGNTSTEIYSYDTNSNRLLSVDVDGNTRMLQYDSVGNIVSDDRGVGQGFTFDYNDQNRMVDAIPSGAQP